MNRKYKNTLFILLSTTALVIAGVLMFLFVGSIIYQGISAISLEFILSPAKNFGKEGGVLYQIIGTLLLVICAGVMTLPIALGTALFQSEYLQNKRLQKLFTLSIYSLNAVPSLLFGVFGLIFFVHILNTGISWFVGSIVLALTILPTVILATHQAITSLPHIYRETALGLGFSKSDVIIKVLIPQGFSGCITGLLLGLARAAGETAPIMFIATAFSGVTIPQSIYEPVLSLPTHILALSQEATDPIALQNAWGAAFALVIIVMFFNLSALFLRNRFKDRYSR